MNTLLIYIKSRKTEYLQILIAIAVFFVFGAILSSIIAGSSDADGSIPVGVITAAMVLIMIHLLVITVSFTQEFNLAISMGQTRKRFVVLYEFISAMELLVFVAIIYVLQFLEQGIVTLISGKNVSGMDLFQEVFALKYIIPGVVGMIVLELFVQALLMKYGTRALWGLWALWMLVTLGPSAIIRYLKKSETGQNLVNQASVLIEDLGMRFWIGTGVVISVVLIIVSWRILRKQQVTN